MNYPHFIFRIKHFISQFSDIYKCTSLSTALKTEIFPYIKPSIERSKYIQKVKLDTLKQQYKELIKLYTHQSKALPANGNDAKIWIMWWQGWDKMPPIVKACIHSIQKHNKSHYPIVLLTKDNFKEYVNLPGYILKKVDKGLITLTHLSDIIRVCLLADHGGLWLDSTIYATRDFADDLLDRPFITIRTPEDTQYVSECKWTSFCLGGGKIKLYQFMRALFFEHWKVYDSFIDYFCIDYGIRILYDEDDETRGMIDQWSIPSSNLYFLQSNLNNIYKESEMKELSLTTTFSKLTYKGRLVPKINDALTYYGEILTVEKG